MNLEKTLCSHPASVETRLASRVCLPDGANALTAHLAHLSEGEARPRARVWAMRLLRPPLGIRSGGFALLGLALHMLFPVAPTLSIGRAVRRDRRRGWCNTRRLLRQSPCRRAHWQQKKMR